MKKVLSIFLVSLLLFSMLGCQHRDDSVTYTFYYPRSDYGYNTLDSKFYNSIIESELRENISVQTAEIIGIYLTGPTVPTLANPFPEKLTLESVSVDDHMLHITVTDHLSELTGINLMIACACLGKTAMELTNTSSVQISCQTALLDGKKSVVFRNDSIIFEDTATGATYQQE